MELHPLTRRLVARVAEAGGEPVAHVVVEDVWTAVVDGTLSSGERLPTAREVAIALNVSPRTVERAYQELAERGVVDTRPGEGTFVRLRLPPETERARHRDFAELCHETVDRAAALGFDVDDLIDAIAEYRTVQRNTSAQELNR